MHASENGEQWASPAAPAPSWAGQQATAQVAQSAGPVGIITVSGLQEIEIHDVDLQFGHWSVRVDRGRSARGAASACPFSAKPLAEASGSRERCYLQGLTALKEEHAAAQWAQSELFFRLLLKNTVCTPQ